MKIAVVGTGYVGLVLGACLAENGNDCICVDKDESKIAGLREGKMPIYEPGLEEMVRRNAHEDRLSFTTDLSAAVKASAIVFIAVGTPQGEDGSADLQHVLSVARDIGRAVNKYTVVVDKSNCVRHLISPKSFRTAGWSASRSLSSVKYDRIRQRQTRCSDFRQAVRVLSLRY